MSAGIVALVFAAFVTAGLVKGTVGLGLPIVVLVFLAVPIGVQPAIALMLIPSVVTNIWQAFSGPSLKALLVRLWSFLLLAICGIWIGVALLSYVTPETTLSFLGGLLALYSVFSLRSPQIRPPGGYERILSPVAGGVGGILFGMTGVFIIPGVLYLQALGLRKNDLVQALGLTFLTISVTMLGTFFERGVLTSDLTLMSLMAVIPTVLGIYLGQRLRHRVSEQLFRTIFFWVLLFVGLYFVVSAQR